jgi:hypothetical protein
LSSRSGGLWKNVDGNAHYLVVLTRLFIEALNARGFEATLVSEDVQLRGPKGSSLRGAPAASELAEQRKEDGSRR